MTPIGLNVHCFGMRSSICVASYKLRKKHQFLGYSLFEIELEEGGNREINRMKMSCIETNLIEI